MGPPIGGSSVRLRREGDGRLSRRSTTTPEGPLVKSLLAALVAIVGLALPSLAFAGGQKGIVVKVNARSGLVAVAQAKGAVRLVHATTRDLRSVRPGSRIGFDATKLRNGTYSAKSIAVLGAVRRVHVRGMIFAVDAKHASFALTAHGAVLPLKLAKHARVLSRTSCGCPHVARCRQRRAAHHRCLA